MSVNSLFSTLASVRLKRREHIQLALGESTLLLLVVGLLSLAIYFLAFVGPYGLLRWWMLPHLDIGKITHHDTRAALAYLLAMVTLFGLYLLAIRSALARHGLLDWMLVIGGAVAFNALLLWLYPVDAVDIFDNIIRGRMTALYGLNPFYSTPWLVAADPFFKYAGWYGITSAYGPGWELLSAGLARLAGNDIVANVLVYKLVSVLGYAGTALLIGLMLRRFAPERALYGIVLFTWNPIVLYVTAGNGHNDAVMVFLISLGIYLMARGNFSLAVLAEAAGALIKFIPILLIPVILIAALRRLKSWPARISFLLTTGGAGLVLGALSAIPFWEGGDFLAIVRREQMFTTSLPTWMVIFLERYMTLKEAQTLASRAALVLLGLWVLYELWNLWRKDGGGDIAANWPLYARAALSILMFYLLVSCLWFQPWYAVWAVALAALLPFGALTGGVLLLSFVVTWKMPIFDFYINGTGYLPPVAVRELPLTAGVMGVPWLYFVYQLIRPRPAANEPASRQPLPERAAE